MAAQSTTAAFALGVLALAPAGGGGGSGGGRGVGMVDAFVGHAAIRPTGGGGAGAALPTRNPGGDAGGYLTGGPPGRST